MTILKLTAEDRSVRGRKVKHLRSKGVLPANVFGKGVKSYAINISKDSFKRVFSEAGETGIVELSVGSKINPVLISNVQVHPVNGDILHVDFRQVDLTEKIKATVPVEVINESPAEKSGIGTVVQQVNELEVEALPVDLPEKFEVDVSVLVEVDQAIFVKNLVYDKSKVKIEADDDQIVVKVEPPQEEKIEEVPADQDGIDSEAVDGKAEDKETVVASTDEKKEE